MMSSHNGQLRRVNLPILHMEILPLRYRSKYRTLVLGLIAHARIRYLSILLQ